MSEFGLVPKVQGRLVDDSITVFVNKKVFDGWESAEIGFNLMSVAGSFSLEIFDRFLQDKVDWQLKPGDLVHIHIGKTPVFTGFIDAANVNFSPTDRSVNLRGRSKAGDIVDCSPVGVSELSNLKLDEIVKTLVKPFGINVLAETDLGKAFSKFAVKPSESVFDSVNRAARMRGKLLISDENGNIVITSKGSTLSRTAIKQGENLKSAAMSIDNSDRFSDYIVKAQSSGIDSFFADSAASIEAKAQDAGIKRNRPTIIVAESSSDGQTAEERAKWEATLRSAKALSIRAEVQGWRKNNGSLWQINELVRFQSPFLGVDSRMLISSVRLRKGKGGTTTSMELVRPDAFDLEKIVKEENDPLAGLKGFNRK